MESWKLLLKQEVTNKPESISSQAKKYTQVKSLCTLLEQTTSEADRQDYLCE
jgi:hypothetical protein